MVQFSVKGGSSLQVPSNSCDWGLHIELDQSKTKQHQIQADGNIGVISSSSMNMLQFHSYPNMLGTPGIWHLLVRARFRCSRLKGGSLRVPSNSHDARFRITYIGIISSSPVDKVLQICNSNFTRTCSERSGSQTPTQLIHSLDKKP